MDSVSLDSGNEYRMLRMQWLKNHLPTIRLPLWEWCLYITPCPNHSFAVKRCVKASKPSPYGIVDVQIDKPCHADLRISDEF